MSLFFGDFPPEDTLAPLAPLAVVDGLMFFSCPACGACVVDREYFQTSRNLHDAWHVENERLVEVLDTTVALYVAHTENLISRVYELEGGDEATVDGGDRVKVGNWGVAPDACGPECSEMHTFVAPCMLANPHDPDAALMEAAKKSNRQVAAAMEQRMLDAMRAKEDPPT